MAYTLLPPDHPLALAARGWPADPNVKPAIPLEPIPELYSFWGIGGPAGKTDGSSYGTGPARLADRNNRLNLHGYYVNGSNEPPLIITPYGEGIERVTPGGNSYGSCAVDVANITAPYRPLGDSDGTLFVAAWVKNTGVFSSLIGCQNPSTGEHKYGVGIHISADGYIYGFRTDNDNSKYARVATPSGNLIVAAFSAKGTLGILSVNGKSATGTILSVAIDSYEFALGESAINFHSSLARYVLDGAILGAGYSKRAWTREELDRATRDFWGTLTRPANQSPFLISVPAGGGAGSINADFIASSAQVFDPTLTAGSADIAADYLASSAQIFEPTIAPGAADLSADAIPSASVIFDPTLSAGVAGITADFIASAAQVFDQSLDAGAADITADFLPSAAAVFEPDLTAAGATVDADFIASAAQVFESTLSAGSAPLFADLIASGSIIYEPILQAGAADIAADFVPSAAQVFDAELTGAGTIAADAIPSSAQVFEPSLTPGVAILTADFLPSAAIILDPELSGGASDIDADYLASATVLYQPALIDATNAFPTGITSLTARRVGGFFARLN